MKKLLLSLLVVGLSGCGSNLRPDPSPVTAIDAGYPTVEMKACGQHFNGAGLCEIKEGQLYNSVGLVVQGYYKGEIDIQSQKCEIDETFRYNAHQSIEILIPGKARKSCTIDIILTPELPKEADSALEIAPLKGRLYIRMTAPNQLFYGQSDKVKQGRNATLLVPQRVGGKKVRVVFKGCGANFDEQVDVIEGFVEVALGDLISLEKQDCILNGVVFGSQDTVRLTWHVWIYDKRLVPLPKPLVKIDGSKLEVEGNTAATVVALNENYEVDHKAKFDFNPENEYILRLLTVKGRNLFAVWLPKDKAWEWHR